MRMLQEYRACGMFPHANAPWQAASVSRRGNPPSIVHRVDVIGVSCYTSTDLIHWYFEGALHTQHERSHFSFNNASIMLFLRHPAKSIVIMGAISSKCTSHCFENQLLTYSANKDKFRFRNIKKTALTCAWRRLHRLGSCLCDQAWRSRRGSMPTWRPARWWSARACCTTRPRAPSSCGSTWTRPTMSWRAWALPPQRARRCAVFQDFWVLV